MAITITTTIYNTTYPIQYALPVMMPLTNSDTTCHFGMTQFTSKEKRELLAFPKSVRKKVEIFIFFLMFDSNDHSRFFLLKKMFTVHLCNLISVTLIEDL